MLNHPVSIFAAAVQLTVLFAIPVLCAPVLDVGLQARNNIFAPDVFESSLLEARSGPFKAALNLLRNPASRSALKGDAKEKLRKAALAENPNVHQETIPNKLYRERNLGDGKKITKRYMEDDHLFARELAALVEEFPSRGPKDLSDLD